MPGIKIQGRSSAGMIYGINARLLLAFGAALMAYTCWPETKRDYVLSVWTACSVFAGVFTFFDAAKLAWQLYRRDRIIAAYLAQGPEPKSAEMVSSDRLREAGMLGEQI